MEAQSMFPNKLPESDIFEAVFAFSNLHGNTTTISTLIAFLNRF